MKSMPKIALVTALSGATVVCAHAGNWGKPGLWQTSTTMQMKMPDMPQISPQQMAQMKKMGIKLPMMGRQAIETKTCLTAEDAANFGMQREYAQKTSGCKLTNMTRVGNHMTTKVVCDGQMKGQGQSDTVLINDSHYTSNFAFKGISHGQPTDMKISTDARWLGANCGSVKPFHHA